MIEQLKVYDTSVMALEIVEGFTEVDYELVEKWANAKREQGFTKMNLLLKLDKLTISDTSLKAFLDQTLKLMKNFKQIGRIAVVAQSKILKKVVPIENFFLQTFSKGSEERYFDVEEIEKAFAFVEAEIKE